MIDLSLDTKDIAKFAKKLNKFQSRNFYVALSKTEQRVVETAQKKAQRSMRRDLHQPAPATVKSVRRRFRQWHRIRNNIGDSAVFVADFMVDELWPNTVTEASNQPKKETKNPQSGEGLILPTSRLRNARGNLRGFRSANKLKQLRADKRKYFEVEVGSKIPGKSGGYLKPGIYQIRRLKRGSKIRLVVAYQDERFIKPKWRLREVVRTCYDEEYPIEFRQALGEELRKVFK